LMDGKLSPATSISELSPGEDRTTIRQMIVRNR
jgi:hypothetical protein